MKGRCFMARIRNESAYRRSKRLERNEKIRALQAEMPSSVADFMRSMAVNSSELTRLNYLYDLRLFFRYLQAEHAAFADVTIPEVTPAMLGALTLRDFDLYKDYLREYVRKDENGDDLLDRNGDIVLAENQAVSIARKLSALRSYYKYLYVNGRIGDNAAANIQMPKVARKPVIYLDRNEISRMLDCVATGDGLSAHQQAYNDGILRIRDIAIVSMLLGTGIRESELVGLDLDDVDFEHRSFTVTRKGGDEAILFFNTQVGDALQAYLEIREQVDACPGHEDALFLSSQRKRISVRALQNLIKKYATVAAPLKKRLSPHKMRSTFATNLYRNTHDIYLVSDSLGHSELETTLRYTAKDEAMRQAAAEGVDWIPDSDSGEA